MKRLLLFDIDGTLVTGGPAKEAFHAALLDTFGTAGPIETHEFSGKTDPQIARELLLAAGLAASDIDEGLDAMFQAYLSGLEAGLAGRPMEVLPGVVDLLDALDAEPDIALGLLTGNIVDGARLKLGSAGLFGRFGVGSFGSDHAERDRLPGVAIERACATLGVSFPGEDVWVIGDTPLDVRCGQSHGTRTLGVATGRYDEHALRAAGADHVLVDFSDTDSAVAVLAG